MTGGGVFSLRKVAVFESDGRTRSLTAFEMTFGG
jgi:hypothetical protein